MGDITAIEIARISPNTTLFTVCVNEIIASMRPQSFISYFHYLFQLRPAPEIPNIIMSSKESSISSITTSSSASHSEATDMHAIIISQMRDQSHRWATWQEKQLQSYCRAASRSRDRPSLPETIETRRVHSHLDRIPSALRRFRG